MIQRGRLVAWFASKHPPARVMSFSAWRWVFDIRNFRGTNVFSALMSDDPTPEVE